MYKDTFVDLLVMLIIKFINRKAYQDFFIARGFKKSSILQ
ncbi:hypothetical protein FTW_1067 [Francisella tularensis subsp. tularensis WY96-3418]|nr:hypothetical protein FTW_1067 [Francisella tularensis subsp. tularensis WY96-3418]ADA78345.1 hypothetical protein NE061598_03785 [Francisella tularensis subsp. tularensis NE061598]AKE21481.1 hypothetical protein RO31_0756 [Francisella tularensis subsp. tularensis str. SCHU S4 substr. NR-28534]